MLTPDQQTALDNLRHFQRTGGNVLSISRRDAAVLVRLLESLGGAPEPQPRPDPAERFCLYCSKEFTADAPARFIVAGEGKLHGGCRSAYERLQAKRNLEQGNVS